MYTRIYYVVCIFNMTCDFLKWVYIEKTLAHFITIETSYYKLLINQMDRDFLIWE